MSITEIAKERKIAGSTIWSHIEKLGEDKQLVLAQVAHLEPDNWSEIYAKIEAAIESEGVEKLKPIFEYCNEEYDYDLIPSAGLHID